MAGCFQSERNRETGKCRTKPEWIQKAAEGLQEIVLLLVIEVG
jgi:hypothetical protein